MKKQIFIIGLGLYFFGCINAFGYFGYYDNYGNYYPIRTSIDQNRYYYNSMHNPYYVRYNNAYCPYCKARSYNSSYYNNRYSPFIEDYSRVKHIRTMKKIKKKTKNKISWLSKDNGTLTGYSMPVQKNILNNYPNKIQPVTSSPTCNTELWNSGNNNTGNSGNSFSYFEKYNNNNQTGVKTGVTIIYD